MPTSRIDSTPVSCGVNYYHDLTLASFIANLSNKQHPKNPPEPVSWGESGYEERLQEIDDYWLAIENEFRSGYCYIFSDNKSGEGKFIAAYIEKHKLGRLTSSGWAKNPNSGNQICTWIWRYNGKKVKQNAKQKTASRRVGRRHGTR